MGHAWLDSLSEDWVSQNGSDTSQCAAVESTTISRKPNETVSSTQSSPGPSPGSVRQFPSVSPANSSNVLSQRSANEINILSSRPKQSKLPGELKVQDQDKLSQRSGSASAAGSVVHNTVERKPSGTSPNKGGTPEWRRRLVEGALGFGEQRDLFSPTRLGLENIFQPPAAPAKVEVSVAAEEEGQQDEGQRGTEQAFEDFKVVEAGGQEPQHDESRHDTTLPSSPPVSQRHYDMSYDSVDGCPAPELPQQPRQFMLRIEDPSDMPVIEEADCSAHSVQSDRNAGIDRSGQHVSEPAEADTTGGLAVSEENHVFMPMKQESRFTSGQSVLRNESFSAILISPEKGDKDGSGAVFGQVELPPGELKRRLENLRWNQVALTDKAGENMASDESISLDTKLRNPESTEEYEKMGGFINFRRGGRSSDGSFRIRLLSPSLEADTSEMLPEESLQASTPKQFPSIRSEKTTLERQHTPMLPRAPNPSPAKPLSEPQSLFSTSGSPLKLFGPYDTFTNQTLMRRISQFEDQLSNGSQLSADLSAFREADDQSKLDMSSVISGSPHRLNMEPTQASRQSSAHFGSGELDGFSFSENGPDEEAVPIRKMKLSREKIPKLPFYVGRSGALPESEGELHVHRQRVSGTKSSVRPHSTDLAELRASPETPRRFASGSEKRLRTSPFKDSTPKRRRTLHKSDIAFGIEWPQTALSSVRATHAKTQSAVARKRREAREEDEFQSAEPDVLANRQIRWPLAPSSSRRTSTNPSQNSADADGQDDDSRADMDAIENWEGSANSSQAGPATGAHMDSDRKPSIRTEDFMNEANKIMAMLRNRGGGIQSGLASLEESEMETPVIAEKADDDSDGSSQQSTQEPFSRPPSREGKPVPRVTRIQEDPEVIARLKQYAERSDLADLVSSTTRSIHLDSETISDPPNMRISESPRRRRSESPSAQSSLRDGMTSQLSQGSVGSDFSRRSFPSGSSHGSESRKTIAPDKVSHLIPDQVGNMMLDRDNNIWIKRRNGSSSQFSGNFHSLPSDCSEDDPFADIPDLSVDVTMELHNLRSVSASAAQESAGLSTTPTQSPTRRSGPTLVTKSDFAAAPLQDGDDGAVEHEISIDEGRGPQSMALKRRQLAISFSSPIASFIQDFVADEDEDEDDCRHGGIAERNESTAATEDGSIPAVQRGRERTVSVQLKRTDTPSRSRSTSRGPSRRFSLAGRAFVARPISRIEEREEDSTERRLDATSDQHEAKTGSESKEQGTPRRQRTNISVLVTTPGDRTMDALAGRGDDEEVMAQYVGMMSLSPMSEFTIHHDRSLALEASYVRGARHLVTGDESTAVMSQSLQSLVKRLAEVEPSEPFWEDLEELDVQDKRLESLHKLDEFCPQLVTLDAAGNALRNLNGVPVSVRHLKVVGNQLSELTSWVSLANLQYLDVSNNAVKTLAGLKNLVHLRGLKADNCSLTDLDGIKYHDALLTLRARGNQIRAVDFSGTRLQRLVELDLEDNEIETAMRLEQLGALTRLNLRRNGLRQFGADVNWVLPQLRTLNVSDNRLTSLDVRGLPSLRTLHADRNRLSSVRGFSKTARLDSVSLREQRLASSERLSLSSLYHAYEIRKLYLSGNRLDKFDPPVDFLNLQLLELANCGLTALPHEFGLTTPNLRKLNVNFNGMTDLRCLEGISRLKKLQVAGNRLAHAYTAIQVLAGFAHLVEADLRDNPLSQGFYPPPVQVVVSSVSGSVSGNVSGSVSGSVTGSVLGSVTGSVLGSVCSDVPTEPFSLPTADEAQDQAYCQRLDLATAMRRRVYEQVVGEACRKLKHLDGLPVRRDLGEVRDAVWEALNAKGIVGERARECASERTSSRMSRRASTTTDGSRWGAEDTFA